MSSHPYAEDSKPQPYWWDEAPPPELPPASLPANVDVAIVGGGYTGLSAALTAGRFGRSVLVLDAENPGYGASSRNGGMVSPRLKAPFLQLCEQLGLDKAIALYREGRNALDYAVELIENEQIQCHLAMNGRFIGAHAPRRYEAMARQSEHMRKHLGADIHMVPKSEQLAEVGSDRYFGGEIVGNFGGLHPAMYNLGLLDRVRQEGTTVAGRTTVTGIRRESDGFTVATSAGDVRAGDVIVATNGYSGASTRWLRRRVIPIGSQMIVTEPLASETMARLMPKNRMMGDSRRLHRYYRPSPDGRRLIFGGRVTNPDLRACGALLYRHMTDLFPVLSDVRITHTWSGNIAFTFDTLPHVGVHDGVHYAMGYCGTGVAMATYLGHKIAQRVLGSKDAPTAFDGLRFPTRPLYGGHPWFLPLAMFCYGLQDRLGR